MTFEERIKNMSPTQKIEYTCDLCGAKNTMTKRQYLKRVYKCPSCEDHQRSQDRASRVQGELKEKGFIGLEDIAKVKYIDVIQVECLRCNAQTSGTIANILRERKKCNCHPAKKFKLNISQEEFLEKISPAIKDKFNILGQYSNRNSKVEIECKECETKRTPWALTLLNLKDLRCLCETRSIGESKILGTLQELGQERDRNKISYCLKNDIELVIISYKDSMEVIQNTLREVLERSTTSREA